MPAPGTQFSGPIISGPRQFADNRSTARRTLIDVGVAPGYGFRVRSTALVSAFGALGLRQQRVDSVDEFGVHGVIKSLNLKSD